MLEGHHHQLAYVTRNLEKSVAEFKARARTRWDAAVDATFNVTTPDAAGTLSAKIAILWVDDVQFEFIQPVSGLDALYRDWLPEGDGLKFHHTGWIVKDWDEMQAGLVRNPWPVVVTGESHGAKFTYVDARATLGHFVEYVWMTPETWKLMGGP